MVVVLRHLLSIALLPFVAVVLVPWWLLASYAGVDLAISVPCRSAGTSARIEVA